MAKKENKEIKKAIEIIDEMSMDEKEWELYESRRLAIMDYNTNMRLFKEEGLEEGLKRGAKQEKIEIAKKLLAKNMPIEEITEITGLEPSQIKSLQNDIEQ